VDQATQSVSPTNGAVSAGRSAPCGPGRGALIERTVGPVGVVVVDVLTEHTLKVTAPRMSSRSRHSRRRRENHRSMTEFARGGCIGVRMILMRTAWSLVTAG
jgi:hypothetical protein